jgi:hypothetical protein
MLKLYRRAARVTLKSNSRVRRIETPMNNRFLRFLFRPPGHSAVRWLLIGAGVFNIVLFVMLAAAFSAFPRAFFIVLGVVFTPAPYRNINLLNLGLALLLLGVAESLPAGQTTLAGILRLLSLVLVVVVIVGLVGLLRAMLAYSM